jgi:hypothetical protein
MGSQVQKTSFFALGQKKVSVKILCHHKFEVCIGIISLPYIFFNVLLNL